MIKQLQDIATLTVLTVVVGSCSATGTPKDMGGDAGTVMLDDEMKQAACLLAWIATTYAHEERLGITVRAAADFLAQDVTVVPLREGIALQFVKGELAEGGITLSQLWEAANDVDLPAHWKRELVGNEIQMGARARSWTQLVVARFVSSPHLSLFAVSASASMWENDVWLVLVGEFGDDPQVISAYYLE